MWKQNEPTKVTFHVSIHRFKQTRRTQGGLKNENKDEINIHICNIVKAK